MACEAIEGHQIGSGTRAWPLQSSSLPGCARARAFSKSCMVGRTERVFVGAWSVEDFKGLQAREEVPKSGPNRPPRPKARVIEN